MRARPPAASEPLTWVLAGIFVLAIGVAVTRTSVLWGPTTFEHTRDMSRIAFAQTYQATRGIYAPAPASRRVVLLGNSRIHLGARPHALEAELAGLGGANLQVENLGIFGAGLGDQEMLSRHLGRLEHRLVVLTLGVSDLLDTPALPLAGVPSRLLAIGWSDGPLGPDDMAVRTDRWARTLWPLYRFREFVRAALVDRVGDGSFPEGDGFPAEFPTTRDLFRYMYGARGDAVEASYQSWSRAPTLPGFVAYLEATGGGQLDLVRQRVRATAVLDEASRGARVLDVLLGRLAGLPGERLVVILPENPLLASDTAGEFHVPGSSDAAVALIRGSAARHGIAVVDGRRWLGAHDFLDFDHPIPYRTQFLRPLAEEVVHALDS